MLLELRTPSQDILQAVHDGRYAGLVACTLYDLDSLFLQPPRHAGSPNSLVPEVAYFGVQEQQLQMWCSPVKQILQASIRQGSLRHVEHNAAVEAIAHLIPHQHAAMAGEIPELAPQRLY